MQLNRRLIYLSLALLLSTMRSSTVESSTAGLPGETQEQTDRRMQWWREAKFGMFIHWGIYAIPAGRWNGKEAPSCGEWIMNLGNIPLEDYVKLQKQFNPIRFDARHWVEVAKKAGMKYIVITSKHHDGFCMFDSKLTDYNIMNTPFGRDILKELSEECRRQNMVLCWYYSIMDWHHPDYLPRLPLDKRPVEAADYDRYVDYMKGQLRELLSNYGKIGVLWFDGEWQPTWTHERGKDLYAYVRGLQPEIIVNNRVDKQRQSSQEAQKKTAFCGDFGTPEQEIPATGLPGVDWESCMTMNDTWGFRTNDHNWKSTDTLIHQLVDIVSKGGNYLLNVGPTAEGLIPEASIERLEAIGRWLEVNGESIYGASASPFSKLDWGRCTQKPGRLYLHVFHWPADGRLLMPGLKKTPAGAYLLADADKKSLKLSRVGNDVVVHLPFDPPNDIDSVIVLLVEPSRDD